MEGSVERGGGGGGEVGPGCAVGEGEGGVGGEVGGVEGWGEEGLRMGRMVDFIRVGRSEM